MLARHVEAPDDQLAARWLYPSGSSTPAPTPTPTPAPTVPAAPSNATASFAGGSSISLQWADKSTNESGFYLYLAFSGGAYSRVGSVGANVTSATISGLQAASYQTYVTAFNSAGTISGKENASSSPPATA